MLEKPRDSGNSIKIVGARFLPRFEIEVAVLALSFRIARQYRCAPRSHNAAC